MGLLFYDLLQIEMSPAYCEPSRAFHPIKQSHAVVLTNVFAALMAYRLTYISPVRPKVFLAIVTVNRRVIEEAIKELEAK